MGRFATSMACCTVQARTSHPNLHSSISCSSSNFATIRPLLFSLLALFFALVIYKPDLSGLTVYQHMLPTPLRQFLNSLSAAPKAMVHKAPPKPTVPTAIKSSEEAKLGEGVEYATFASGCFWGTEHLFAKHFSHLPQFSCMAGYTGGNSKDPSYRQVCSGSTGHAEAVRVGYQKGAIGYGELVEFFYRTHDPTTADRQGPDRGTQYRSAIFYNSPEQADIAKKVTAEVQEKYLKSRPIVTQIVEAREWYNAEDYHQKYLENNPGGYECPTHRFYW